MIVHIGDHISELLEEKKLTIEQFSDLSQLTIIEANLLLNGKIEVDEKIAQKLKDIFGVPVDFWVKLQEMYKQKYNKDI